MFIGRHDLPEVVSAVVEQAGIAGRRGNSITKEVVGRVVAGFEVHVEGDGVPVGVAAGPYEGYV